MQVVSSQKKVSVRHECMGVTARLVDEGGGQAAAAPLPLVEALQRGLRLAQLLLHLHAAVEDGAVPGGAQHILVQAALAALALRPQGAELRLEVVDAQQRALVDLPLLRCGAAGVGWQGGRLGSHAHACKHHVC